MNHHDQPSPDREELRDQLIDAGLRERLGGERPPDLSGVILERAAQDAAAVPSTREAAMSTTDATPRPRALRYFSIAATVLIAVGMTALLLPPVEAPREAARRAAEVQPGSERSGNEVFEYSAREHSETSAADNQKLIMLATPKIIIEEEEAERLGVAVDAPGKGPVNEPVSDGTPGQQEGRGQFAGVRASSAAATSDRTMYYGTNEIKSPASGYTVDLSQPFRQGSFGMEQPQFVEGGPAAAPNYGWHSIKARRFPSDEWENVGNPTGNVESIENRDAQRLTLLKQKLLETEVEIKALEIASGNSSGGELQNKFARRTNLLEGIRRLEERIGRQPGGDKYARIVENPFLPISAANTDHRLSTFSIDVDTASYANVRQFLLESHVLPPPDAVRIEELVNYFDYQYTPPTGDVPFAAHVEVAGCPWAPEHRLVRVGIKGREMERTARPLSNKLPLLVAGMKQLTRQLGENDRVAIVVYASSEGLALGSTPGTDQSKILAALDQLSAGGSTAGGAGIQLAYQVAQENFIKGGVNRVILCTDGDFNVGVTSPAELERMAETNAKETGVFLTVLAFGRGNLNDAMMEQVADKGNGNYHYIDSDREARKVLVEEMTGTLVTIAKDVKIQIEFNPEHVAGYRLIGYENRVMAAEDFNDDKKDAGEIGAGHTVTALYEVVPAGKPVASTPVDELKYAPKSQSPAAVADQEKGEPATGDGQDPAEAPASDELLTLKIRYKAPDGQESSKLEFPIVDGGGKFGAASDDLKFAAAVAGFGMLLRDSEYKGNANFAAMAEIAEGASAAYDPHGYRREFVEMAKRAGELAGE
jgi:secreted protein with Ig-like and vWFA domain